MKPTNNQYYHILSLPYGRKRKSGIVFLVPHTDNQYQHKTQASDACRLPQTLQTELQTQLHRWAEFSNTSSNNKSNTKHPWTGLQCHCNSTTVLDSAQFLSWYTVSPTERGRDSRDSVTIWERQRFRGHSVPKREMQSCRDCRQRFQGHSVISIEKQRLQGPSTHSCHATVRPRQTSCDGCNYCQTLSQNQFKHSVWMPLCGGRFFFIQGNQCHAKYSLNFTWLYTLLLLLFIPKIKNI